MAKQKKQESMITYTEILSRAIRQMQEELESWETRMAGKPGMEEYIEAKRDELCPKIEAAKTLYKIETGTDY